MYKGGSTYALQIGELKSEIFKSLITIMNCSEMPKINLALERRGK